MVLGNISYLPGKLKKQLGEKGAGRVDENNTEIRWEVKNVLLL